MSWFPRAVCIFLAICIPLGSLSAEDNKVTIGVLVCQSGPCAEDGIYSLNGINLAVREINAAGGILGKQISLQIEDTEEAVLATKAVSAYRKLRLYPAISFFIGPSWTPASQALAPIIAKEPDISIATASSGAEEFHRAGPNLFNVRGTDQQASRLLARKALELGYKRAAIFSSQQNWEVAQGEFFADEYTKSGGTVAVKLEPLPTLTDLRTEALKIVSSKPDVVIFTNYVQLGLAAKALKDLNCQLPKMGIVITPDKITEAQGWLDGAISSELFSATSEFSKKYKDTYGSEPQLTAPVGYDTVYTYFYAMQKAGSLVPQLVQKQILALDFPGASGRIRFDAQGGAIREVKFSKVIGGKLVPLK